MFGILLRPRRRPEHLPLNARVTPGGTGAPKANLRAFPTRTQSYGRSWELRVKSLPAAPTLNPVSAIGQYRKRINTTYVLVTPLKTNTKPPLGGREAE